MAKCRGCGGDTRDYQGGPGWMHYECEIKRLEGLLDELQRAEDDLVRILPVELIDVLNEDVIPPPAEQWKRRMTEQDNG